MDKMIKGKKYDTATAKVIGAYTEDEGDRRIQETLYQKRRGSFFLEGTGGSTSRYAQRKGSQWISGSDIIPLSYKEAEDWAKTHLSAEDYDNIFGEIYDNKEKKVTTLSLSVATVERAKREASKNGMNLSEYVEYLINQNK